MWISKKKLNREIKELRIEAIRREVQYDFNNKLQFDRISKLESDVKKLKKMIKEGY